MKTVTSIVTALAVAAFAGVQSASAINLALWTFETSVPTNAGPHPAEGGLNAGSPASGLHASGATVYDNPSGNGSLESFSSNNWAINDYYQFSTSTLGYQNIMIEWDQVSSNTGPRDFDVLYGSDGTNFTSFGSITIRANASPAWTSGSSTALDHYTANLSTFPVVNNGAVYIRLVDRSTVSANGATVLTGGTDRIDNFQIDGTLIPEPASLALLAIGCAALLRRKR